MYYKVAFLLLFISLISWAYGGRLLQDSSKSQFVTFKAYAWKENLVSEEFEMLMNELNEGTTITGFEALTSLSVHNNMANFNKLIVKRDDGDFGLIYDQYDKYNGKDDYDLFLEERVLELDSNVDLAAAIFFQEILYIRTIKKIRSGRVKISPRKYSLFNESQKKCIDLIYYNNSEELNSVLSFNYINNIGDAVICLNCLFSDVSKGVENSIKILSEFSKDEKLNISKINLLSLKLMEMHFLIAEQDNFRILELIGKINSNENIVNALEVKNLQILKGVIQGKSDEAIFKDLQRHGETHNVKTDSLVIHFREQQEELKRNRSRVPLNTKATKYQIVTPEDNLNINFSDLSNFELAQNILGEINSDIYIQRPFYKNEQALYLRRYAKELGQRFVNGNFNWNESSLHTGINKVVYSYLELSSSGDPALRKEASGQLKRLWHATTTSLFKFAFSNSEKNQIVMEARNYLNLIRDPELYYLIFESRNELPSCNDLECRNYLLTLKYAPIWSSPFLDKINNNEEKEMHENLFELKIRPVIMELNKSLGIAK